MLTRILDLKDLANKKSLIFLGPRQTGKSTHLLRSFPDAHFINLLESDTLREYSTYPERLRERLPFQKGIVVIDEFQLAPQLLNEVHLLIERHKNLRFILSGSSARKLKNSQANLLAGRAWPIHFHPLCSKEINPKSNSDWLNYLQKGGIPSLFLSTNFNKDASSYIGTYLQEEIKKEGIVRSTERFSRFLDVAILCNGEIINFTKISRDCGIPSRTVQEYFKILEDTLLSYQLRPLQTHKRKSVSTSKFYFFDLGITNYINARTLNFDNHETLGRALEHLIFLELRAYLDYKLKDETISYWRTQNHHEVDFVIGKKIAIEVKASKNITTQDEKNLNLLGEEIPKLQKIIVCQEKKIRKTENGTRIIPFIEFLNILWNEELF